MTGRLPNKPGDVFSAGGHRFTRAGFTEYARHTAAAAPDLRLLQLVRDLATVGRLEIIQFKEPLTGDLVYSARLR